MAINSSPRTQGESRSERLLLNLVKGMKQEGAQIERTLPSYKPFIESNGEKSGRSPRVKFPDFMVLSAAGFPEFQLLSDWCKVNFDTDHSRLRAEIYRPGAQALTQSIYKEVAQDVYNACVEAGRELIKNGAVSEPTMARITQKTQEKPDWIKTTNLYWQSCIDEKMVRL